MDEKIQIKVSIKGKPRYLSGVRVSPGAAVVITGRFIKTANIHDEFWLESKELPGPSVIIEKLRKLSSGPDIYKFAQKYPEVTPQYNYHMEWDNLAVVSFNSYTEWFQKINRSVRKHIRKAAREGVRTDVVAFSDNLVHGICSVYNESPVRQGKEFWHYGKSFEEVKSENASFLDRSIFIGAYFADELIAFLKIVIDGPVAHIMQIISKASFFDKRATNAILSKAVEVCESKRVNHLSYGSYFYGNKTEGG